MSKGGRGEYINIFNPKTCVGKSSKLGRRMGRGLGLINYNRVGGISPPGQKLEVICITEK